MYNSAYSRGGAIYSDFTAATHPAYRNCFISSPDFSPVNSTFIFKGNSAVDSGDSVFTTTFESCALLCSHYGFPKHPSVIMQCIANFTFDKTKSALSTHPDKFSLHEKTPIELIPGKSHILNFSATDEANRVNLSHLVYRTSVTNSNVSIDQAFWKFLTMQLKY